MPAGPEDGLDGQRVSDLIVMADTLEHREGISHVAFNFLVGEITAALKDGIEAENAEIALRWGQTHSRLYITKMIRSLNNSGVFLRGWHSERDDESGRNRRRRTFNLDRNHPLVVKILDRYPATVQSNPQTTSEDSNSGLSDSQITSDTIDPSDPLLDNEQDEQEANTNLGKVMRFFSRSSS